MNINNFITFLSQHFPELWQKLLEQMGLVSFSILLAMLMGIPIGIMIARISRMRQITLSSVSILQTIPSLALLTFLLPFFGIGIKPAIIALTLYALLPMISNTCTGIMGIAPSLREAADGMGLNPWQRLRLIELPLAMPVILTGIRTATVISVGIATLATFIGGGGLGDFISRGLASNNMQLVLLGAIPAAILALILDFLIVKIEQKFNIAKPQKQKNKILISLTILFLLSFGIVFKNSIAAIFVPEKQPTIRIASKNFTEQFILAELMAQLIEAKTNLKIDRKFNLGTTEICHRAMLKGEIDIYPEYTGTALFTVLKNQHRGTAEQIYKSVKSDYKRLFQIIWLQPFGFNNTQALAITSEFSQKKNLKNLSDLKKISHQLIIAVPAEFLERPDGMPALRQAYGIAFKEVKQMESGLLYAAMNEDLVDVIMAFSTSGYIPAYHLQLLEDDAHYFPPYYAAPLIRQAVLEKYPEIEAVLNELANILSEQTMQALNAKVDQAKQSPREVAQQFLIQKGLLKSEPTSKNSKNI